MDTTRLPHEWKEFLRLLISNEVQFLLIGGVAVAYYGYPRATGDIDVWVGRSGKNAKAVHDALVAFGLELPEDFQRQFLQERKVFRFGRQPLRIEVLNEISGVAFEDCFQRRHHAQIDGIELDVIALDDLKVNKRASGRTNDIDDLANLP